MSRSSLYKVAAVAALMPLVLTTACGGTTKDAAVTSAGSAPSTGSAQSGEGSGQSGAGGGQGPAVVLGASLSMTGPLGQFGVDLKTGYQQQIKDLNAAGGLDIGGTKRPVTLTVLDNRSDPNTATQQIRELVLKDKAVALLGACTPPIVIPEALAAEQQKVPLVSSCNPVRAFQAGNASAWKYAWDLFFDEGDQATAVAKALLMTSSNKKVAIFTDTEPDGVAERGLYKAAFKTAGLDVVEDYSFPVGTSDYSSFVSDAKSKGAQLLAGQMIPPDGIALWKQMKSLKFAPAAAFVAKASAGQSWTKALGPIAEGTLSDAFWSVASGKANSAQVGKALGQQFPNNLGDLNIAVLGYTVASIVTDGIKAAGSTDPAKVNAAIGKTNADYLLGKIAFGDKHTAITPYLVTQWQGGNTVQILPADPPVKLQAPVKGMG